MESESISDVQKLIRLKRFECPPDEAVDDFLFEFQRRQRSQALTGSSRKLLFERIVTYMSSFGERKWVYGAMAAYACVMLFFLVRPSDTPMGRPAGEGATRVGAPLKPIIDAPAYDPRLNRARPLPTQEPDVIVF